MSREKEQGMGAPMVVGAARPSRCLGVCGSHFCLIVSRASRKSLGTTSPRLNDVGCCDGAPECGRVIGLGLGSHGFHHRNEVVIHSTIPQNRGGRGLIMAAGGVGRHGCQFLGRKKIALRGGGGHGSPFSQPPPPPSLAAVTGGGVQGGGARPAVPGGGGQPNIYGSK